MVIDTLRRFFVGLADQDRDWMTLACAFQIEGEAMFISKGVSQSEWFAQFLDSPVEPEQQFGRVLWLVSIIDFELSDNAIARTAARWRRLSSADQVAGEGAVGRIRRLSDVWKDVRAHELDDAALWIFRDEAQRRQATG